MSFRILVLTSSTGSGHDMRAKAFADWMETLYGNASEVHIEQIIENGSLLGRFGVWIYNTIQSYLPILHNLYFFIVEAFIFSHSGSVSFGGKYYRKLLKDFQPDLVFSVHDSTNRGYFEDARRILGEKVRCGTYCGEFSGGYGYSRNWVNTSADFFIARTSAAAEHAIRLGMPADRVSVFHKFLPPDAFKDPLSDEAKSASLQKLAFSEDRFTLFLATGGFGANHHLTYLDQLLSIADRLQVIVVCGRNEKIFKQVNEWSDTHPELRMHVEGYSRRMAEYLQLSNAVVTRGGANTTTEALHFGCPILYDSLGGIMPQEHCTVRYFVERGAARVLRKASDLHGILSGWSQFDAEYEQIRTQLSGLHAEEDPKDLIAGILGEDTSIVPN